jgi:hypothetical protein
MRHFAKDANQALLKSRQTSKPTHQGKIRMLKYDFQVSPSVITRIYEAAGYRPGPDEENTWPDSPNAPIWLLNVASVICRSGMSQPEAFAALDEVLGPILKSAKRHA